MNVTKKKLQYGLNIKLGKKTKAAGAFLDNEDDEVTPVVQSQREAKSIQLKKEALEGDSALFDYDDAFDKLKEQEMARKRHREGISDDGSKKARYMENLIDAAKKRRVEVARIKEKKAAARMVEEDDGREVFVTQGFLDTKKDAVEECDDIPEDEEKDMASFYRGILNKTSRDAVLITHQSAVSVTKDPERIKPVEGIARNESNEILDKRQLLKGGLNVSASFVSSKAREKEVERKETKYRQDRTERTIKEVERKKPIPTPISNFNTEPINPHQKVSDAKQRFLERQKLSQSRP